MKFLFVSKTGGSLGMAINLANNGHKVSISSLNSIGEGMVSQTSYTENLLPLAYAQTPDLIIVDEPSLGKQSDALRSKGFRVVCNSRWSDAMFNNKSYSNTVIKNLGFELYDGKQEGYPITIEGWFNGNSFINSYIAFIYNRFMNDNLGQTVDCSGILINGKFNYGKLYDETIKKIETPLRRTSYCGPVSVNIIINNKSFYVSSIDAYPKAYTTYMLCEGTKTPFADLLLATVSGNNLPMYIDDWVIGVALSIPPYPNQSTSNDVVNIEGVNKYNDKHVWFVNARKSDGKYKGSGLLGYVAARGKNIREARRRVYRTISNIVVPDLQYRTDIGVNIPLVFKDLKSWRWL